MKLILITLFAVVVVLMVACGEKSTPTAEPSPPTPVPTIAATLTESLIYGLIKDYSSSGATWDKHWGNNDCFPDQEAAPACWGFGGPGVPNPYPGFDCVNYGKDKPIHKGAYWEILASGTHCDGIEIFRVEDSYDGVVTRIRPRK